METIKPGSIPSPGAIAESEYCSQLDSSEVAASQNRSLPPRAHALAYVKRGWYVLPTWWIEDGRCACGKSEDVVERLAAKPGEKPKAFKDSLVCNIREWLDEFRFRNITNDGELAAIVSKAERLLDGADPQLLRDSESTREVVAQGFAAIKAQLDTMVVQRPSRRVRFDKK